MCLVRFDVSHLLIVVSAEVLMSIVFSTVFDRDFQYSLYTCLAGSLEVADSHLSLLQSYRCCTCCISPSRPRHFPQIYCGLGGIPGAHRPGQSAPPFLGSQLSRGSSTQVCLFGQALPRKPPHGRGFTQSPEALSVQLGAFFR